MNRPLALLIFFSALSAQGAETPARILSLDEVLATADKNQPQLRQARAAALAAEARADFALAPLLPQVTGSAAYQRTTGNFASRPGTTPSGVSGVGQSKSNFDTFNYYNLGVSASQLVYDFGQTSGRFFAAKAAADAERATEQATLLSLRLTARTVYFQTRAARALMQVAQETLDNQERHLAQIQGFYEIGTRPQIDLVQARSDRANARVQLINAENGYETNKVRLNQAMGVEGPTDFDVKDEAFPEVSGEAKTIDELLDEAVKSRSELISLLAELRSQEATLGATQGGYGPSLSIGTALTDAGTDPKSLAWNWNAGATLTWQLFQGGATAAQVAEAHAELEGLRAQVDALRQQIRLEVDQARLAVKGTQASLDASGEAVLFARQRLRLAEGRYETGVGSVIELSDAQLALTSAEAQKVQADLNLATARAQLLQALGRP